MNAAQLLVLAVGAVVAGVTFGLLRYPHTRREPFSSWGAYSFRASVLGAALVFGCVAALAVLQGL